MPDQGLINRRRPVSKLIIVTGLGALIAFLLLSGHGNHLLSLAPFLIFLACPLMHLFMHHGNGHHGESDRQNASRVE